MTPQAGPRTAVDALVDALYEDGCLPPPQTDHTLHVIASLQRHGYRIEAEAAPAAELDSIQVLRDWVSLSADNFDAKYPGMSKAAYTTGDEHE